MSYRQRNPRKNLLDSVVETQGEKWSQATIRTARSDAFRILEALVSDMGVDGVIDAMDRQGFEGTAYRYLIAPLFDEAVSRRPSPEEE